MALRRKKTKRNQALDLLETYLKLQAAKKATKGARKAAKGTAVYKVAKDKPRVVRVIPFVAGAGVAAVLAPPGSSAAGTPPPRTPEHKPPSAVRTPAIRTADRLLVIARSSRVRCLPTPSDRWEASLRRGVLATCGAVARRCSR